MQLEVLEKDRDELIPLVLTRAAERRMRAIGRVWLGAHLHASHTDALRRTHSDALKRTQTHSDAIRRTRSSRCAVARSPRAAATTSAADGNRTPEPLASSARCMYLWGAE